MTATGPKRRGAPAAAALAALGASLIPVACGGPGQAPVETDLGRRFELATVTAESHTVLPGDYAQRRELLDGWSPPRQDETGTYADNKAAHTGVPWRESSIDWRLAWNRPLELVLTGRSMAAPEGESTTVAVSWNDEELGRFALTVAPEDYRLAVPVEVQRTGSNRIDLDYATSSGASTEPSPVAWHRIRVEGAGAGARPAALEDGVLRLPFRSALDYYVLLPEGGALDLAGLSLYGPQGAWRNADPAPGVTVSVWRYPEAPAAVVETFTGGKGRLRLKEHDRPIRIRLEPAVGERVPDAEAGFTLTAVLSSPTWPWPHAAAPEIAAAGEATAPASDAPLPHVLIFLVDTLRADHLGSYGYHRPTSPNIDRFAESAVLFENAVAQSSWTRPTTASVLTGLYPHHHGARSRNDRLGEDVPYLPEILQSLGYRALGVTTNSIVGPAFGFRRGFSHHKHFAEWDGRPGMYVPAWRAVNATLEWLERIEPGDSFFVYLHVSDPHHPYHPPPAQREQFAPGAPPTPAGTNLATAPDPVKARYVDLYDGEIAHVDEQFGRLLDALDERGFLDDTLVVFVSDHGEEFLDHGHYGHGSSLYQEQIHVPLIIRMPRRLRAETQPPTVATQVQQIDIVPTILEAIGHSDLIETDGRSLLALMRSATGQAAHNLAISDLRSDGEGVDVVLLELADSRRKLIDYGSATFGAAHQLFDTAADPGEVRNLRDKQAHWAGYLRAVGRLQYAASGAVTAGVEPDLPPEQRKALEALGYLD